MDDQTLLDGVAAPEAAPVDSTPEAAPIETDSLPEFLRAAGLDDETSKEKALLNFKSVGDLAKSYVSAKKFLGADKIKIPNAGSSDEEWVETFKKLGLPETADKYEFKLDEKGAIDKDFLANFSPIAHKAGLLPKQAQAVLDFYNGQINETFSTMEAEAKVNLEKNKALLQEEWGEAYNAKLDKARFALKEFGGEEMADHLKSLGAAADSKVLSFLAKVGEAVSGDNMPGIKDATGGPMTPDAAAIRMDEIRAEMLMLNDSTSPKYALLQKEQERMAKFAYPTQMTVFPADGE